MKSFWVIKMYKKNKAMYRVSKGACMPFSIFYDQSIENFDMNIMIIKKFILVNEIDFQQY